MAKMWQKTALFVSGLTVFLVLKKYGVHPKKVHLFYNSPLQRSVLGNILRISVCGGQSCGSFLTLPVPNIAACSFGDGVPRTQNLYLHACSRLEYRFICFVCCQEFRISRWLRSFDCISSSTLNLKTRSSVNSESDFIGDLTACVSPSCSFDVIWTAWPMKTKWVSRSAGCTCRSHSSRAHRQWTPPVLDNSNPGCLWTVLPTNLYSEEAKYKSSLHSQNVIDSV